MIQSSANCILRLPAIKRTSESTKQIGRYLLFDEHKIGEGKFGQVYLACEEEALKKTVENLRQYQHRVIGVKTDVLVEESIKELFAKATEEYGNVHILCNNAGIGANSGNKAIWEIESTSPFWMEFSLTA